MRDLSRETNLAAEAIERDAFAGHRLRPQRLDRNRLLQLPVERSVDHAHPADAEHSLNVIAVCEHGARPLQLPARLRRGSARAARSSGCVASLPDAVAR